MKNKTQTGFTLIELLVVISILTILIGLTTINVLHAHRQSILTASFDTFIADLKQQQLKAMTNDTEGRNTSDNYGIYFGTNTYTLFHGTYSASDPANSVIKLGDNLEFSNITFPGSQILFLKTSGEVSDFTNGSNTITIKDITNNIQKTITINRYGIITDIN
jgi:prepilin-type N-terminal cleavage/methylation domain-containing protein